MKTLAQSIVIAVALVAAPPALAKPHRAAAKATAVKKKPAKAAAPKTATQMLAPPVLEGPSDLPAAAVDRTSPMPKLSATAEASPASRRVADPAVGAAASLSPVQAACQGSQGQSVAIPNGLGSQTTRCGVNAALGRTDARVDYRVRSLAPR